MHRIVDVVDVVGGGMLDGVWGLGLDMDKVKYISFSMPICLGAIRYENSEVSSRGLTRTWLFHMFFFPFCQIFCTIARYISFIVVQGFFCSIVHILTVSAATLHSPCSQLLFSSPSPLPSSSHHHLPCALSSPPKYPLEVVSSPSALDFL